MTNFKSFEYSILKYVHDTVTGEFLNVGVVLYSNETNFIRSKFKTTITRISNVFPDVNRIQFKKTMKHLNKCFKDYQTELDYELKLKKEHSIRSYIFDALPQDDSSLQWSEIKCGITLDLESETDKIFDRYVALYDSCNARERRTEVDIWRDFEKTLSAFHLPEALKPKLISTKDDEVEFKHAWKNGIWHCIEPISFDLSNSDNFKEKAHRWLGQMASIHDAKEDFKLYLLLGQPSDHSLCESFHKAVSILNKMPVEKQIFLEEESSALASIIKHEMVEHAKSSSH
ncbi:DUF3037 domain-containing protein [Pseudomonas sp. MAHUQ-62]|uniref:DUF3037 domain-containing protein n=1 Tax=Pseudomonas sp. GCM10023245 TaxID=3252652 RepID=UPI00361F9A5B